MNGQLVLVDVALWPIATVSAVQRDVWSWGYTGSDRTMVKTALLTPSGRNISPRLAYARHRVTGAGRYASSTARW
jgi:hypothetical protein